MLGVAFYSGGTGFYFPFYHRHDASMFGDRNLPEEWLSELQSLFDDEDKIWVFHNAQFDLNILEKHGLIVKGVAEDTMIMAHLANENYKGYRPYSLDSLCKRLMGVEKDDIRKKVLPHFDSWEAIPPIAMGKYAVTDVKLTYDLYHVVKAQLEKEGLTQLWESEDRQFVRVLARVIAQGILLDQALADQLSQRARNRLQEIQHTLGFAPSKKAELCHSLHGLPESGGLGLPALEGLSKVKNAEFPQGLPKANTEALSRLRLESIPDQAKQVIDLTLEYRTLQKAASTYYEGLLRRTSKKTGLVHPALKQHGTKTGRLSGDMQQVPRDRKKYPVKDLFISPPGWELWEFDYSQVELRLAVVYAQCESLGRAYINGDDIHEKTGRLIGAYDHLDPVEARQIGKTSNFLLGYLGGALRLQATIFKDTGMVVSLEFCEEVHRNYHLAYPEFKKKGYEVIAFAEKNGYIKLWNGRKVRFPYKSECFGAWNNLIQGGAGQIMKHSMMKLHGKYKMVNQVHDSLWIYLPTDEVEEQKKNIIEIMEWPTQDLGFPFPVDAKRLDYANDSQ